MADKSKTSTDSGKTWVFRKSKLLWLVILAAVALLFAKTCSLSILPRHIAPVNRPQQNDLGNLNSPNWSLPAIEVKAGGGTVTIQIRPDQWTNPIKLPPNTKFRIDYPNEIEIFFWTGERGRFGQGVHWPWPSTVPHSIFALRGTKGEAVIHLDP